MDGGVVNNAPFSHAVDLGADTIYVLSTGYSCALDEPPASALGMTLHAITLLINRRLSIDVDHYLGRADVRVIPPPWPVDVGPGDFSRAGELIDRSYASAAAWLRTDADQRSTNPLSDHLRRHGKQVGTSTTWTLTLPTSGSSRPAATSFLVVRSSKQMMRPCSSRSTRTTAHR